MLLRQFPDINTVRKLKNDATNGSNEWRNVVLNFECREASRLNVESPYSLFINKKGFSYCTINDRNYRVETDRFLFAQPGDIYGLTIDNLQQTELCNVHINKRFFDNVVRTLTATDEQLIDDPDRDDTYDIRFFSQLYTKDETFNVLAGRLTRPETYTNNCFEPALIALIEYVVMQNQTVRKSISKLPFAKASVRTDIYERLSIARDYMHSHYDTVIDLDNICREAGMSKFHFLRVFKSCFGISPYQYISSVRMQKARWLLQNTNDSISEISSGTGFDYPNSFIKAFQKAYHTSPLQFRKHEISNFG